MSFWNTSSGESAIANTTTSFEIEGGGDMLPIPAGTKVLALIENVKKATVKDSTEQYAEIKWNILKPEAYKNRKIFHKVWCYDLDPSVTDPVKAKAKRDKALKMLATIDSNSGGKLAQAGVEPTGDSLAMALNNSMMVIGLNTWDDRETKQPRGNWVYYVGQKNEAITEVTKGDVKAQAAKVKESSPVANWEKDLGDSIPF